MANQPAPDPSDAFDVINSINHLMLPLAGLLIAGVVAQSLIKVWFNRPYQPPTEHPPITQRTPRSATRTPNPGPNACDLWAAASQITEDLLTRVAEWEFDPNERFFNRPLLADVDEPLTAEWLEAQAALAAAMPDYKPANTARAQRALDAAERARAAWDAAWRYAGSIGLGTLPERDRQRLSQAQKILAQAADHATTPAERALCIDRLVALLAEVTTVDRATARHTVTKFISAQLALPAPAARPAITGDRRRSTLRRDQRSAPRRSA
ncbi:hypothetical protein [Mycobacterium sp.]|uniref:hypothetical protein n=1 Tax=Mycobacterium sp. TaxID=1785 RepID=UPI0025D21A48|nr:hypothetical protein [Mycobacterium sp.]